MLPSFEEIPSYSPHAWPYHAPRVLGDARFDHAWIWLGRTPFDDVFLEWLASVATVRIGVLAQPLDYPADTYRRSPHLLAHRSAIEQQVRHLTHVLACDEVDARSIDARLGLPAMWLPPAVSARSISAAATGTSHPRTPVLVDEASDAADAAVPTLSQSMVRKFARLDPAAYAGSLGEELAALQREQITSLAAGAASIESLRSYVASRLSIRTALAERRPRAVGQGGAVTLAPDTNAYPAVVFECMAARVPVVCRDIPYRPRNRALFVPGRHIRLFGISDQESFAGHVRDLHHDPSAAQAQVEAALAVVQREHTAERRVDQVFEWLSTGRIPDVTCDQLQPQGNPDASRWFLPASYRRRAASRSKDEGEGHTAVHQLAVALARASACTRLVDIGCPDPLSLVRASRDISAVGICAPHVLQSHQRRCADVAWHDVNAGESSLLASVEFDEATLVLCAMWDMLGNMAQREADDVRAVLEQISKAWQARRYEELSQLFAQDMVFALPGQAVRVEGRDAIVASYREFMDRITMTSYREDQHSVDVWGGTAIASFRWDMAWLAGDVPNHETGCDVFAFTRIDGRWLAVWRTMLMEPKTVQG